MTLFEPILSNLGFHQLSAAVPSLSDSAFMAWNGPITLFAPSDISITRCFACSVPLILREHIVPGLFSFDYVKKLSFGTKIETMSPGHCVTVTNDKNNSSKIFINGVEITHPNMFNNGIFVIHGLHGIISPLSAFSCNVERLNWNSLAFPFHSDFHSSSPQQQQKQQEDQFVFPSVMMKLMLRDAMLRLRNSGFSVLSLAMKIKFPELSNLQNMTVFTLDDASIFSGSHAYVSSVRFHIVPNRLLTMAELEKLPVGTVLPTLERGQNLVVTTAGGIMTMRINYVRIKSGDVMKNPRMAVHSLYLPFPRIHTAVRTTASGDGPIPIGGGGDSVSSAVVGGSSSCGTRLQGDGCNGGASVSVSSVGPTFTPPSMASFRPLLTDVEDQHGL
ncbi:FAS1 domain [Dillenia turbinata]|uniref:FAS1 domain n=1 Tax=Dillenia turbinata TaxID=194707 RepID=A0AAN8Z7N5_9MAGN